MSQTPRRAPNFSYAAIVASSTALLPPRWPVSEAEFAGAGVGACEFAPDGLQPYSAMVSIVRPARAYSRADVILLHLQVTQVMMTNFGASIENQNVPHDCVYA